MKNNKLNQCQHGITLLTKDETLEYTPGNKGSAQPVGKTTLTLEIKLKTTWQLPNFTYRSPRTQRQQGHCYPCQKEGLQNLLDNCLEMGLKRTSRRRRYRNRLKHSEKRIPVDLHNLALHDVVDQDKRQRSRLDPDLQSQRPINYLCPSHNLEKNFLGQAPLALS